MKRREFLKAGILGFGAATIFGKMGGLISNAYAMAGDATVIKKKAKVQKYVHNIFKLKKADVVKLAGEKTAKKKYWEEAKDGVTYKSACINCTQYKKTKFQKEAGDSHAWGKCSMVGANGDESKGKAVFQGGWCKVYSLKKKNKFNKPTFALAEK